jgi:hypothetical protein
MTISVQDVVWGSGLLPGHRVEREE